VEGGGGSGGGFWEIVYRCGGVVDGGVVLGDWVMVMGDDGMMGWWGWVTWFVGWV